MLPLLDDWQTNPHDFSEKIALAVACVVRLMPFMRPAIRGVALQFASRRVNAKALLVTRLDYRQLGETFVAFLALGYSGGVLAASAVQSAVIAPSGPLAKVPRAVA